MGYRNDIYIITTKDHFEFVKSKFEENNVIFKTGVSTYHDPYIRLEWIKWEPHNFKFEAELEDYFSSIEDEYLPDDFLVFIRIGEDIGDVEVNYYGEADRKYDYEVGYYVDGIPDKPSLYFA